MKVPFAFPHKHRKRVSRYRQKRSTNEVCIPEQTFSDAVVVALLVWKVFSYVKLTRCWNAVFQNRKP